MKKMITNFLLLIFCSIPRLLKAQISTDKFNITNEGKSSRPKFIENALLFSSGLVVPAYNETDILTKKDLTTAALSVKEEIEKLSRQQVKYAMMLNVAVETIKNTTLYKFIENWYGTRYKMGGNTKKGIDCSAFTNNLLSQVYNLLIPRTAKQQYKFCARINKENLLEGDLVFFNTRGGVSHVGVYLDNGHFIHSSKSRGVAISSLDNNYFSKRYIGAGRVQNN